MLEPELLLCLPEQTHELPVMQVLCGMTNRRISSPTYTVMLLFPDDDGATVASFYHLLSSCRSCTMSLILLLTRPPCCSSIAAELVVWMSC
jgi:hypothetical protein